MRLINMDLRSTASMIPYALDVTEGIATELGMDGDDVLRMRLNLEEVLIGIVEYGYGNNPDASVSVTLSSEDGMLMASVRDRGMPYDYETLGSNGYSDLARILTGTDFGPELLNHGREGREQVFGFPIPRCSGDVPRDTGTEPVEGMTFDMHIMRPEEGMQVSQCLYDEFGYTYVNDIVYFPGRLAEATRTGALVPFTAVSDSGEVAAHVALVSNPHLTGTMELAMGVVKRRFRKASLMSRLTDMALSHAEASGLVSVNAQPVGYHPYTQRICEATSMGACAVCFNYACSDMASTYGTGARMPLFWAVRMMGDVHRDIHAPDEVRHIVDMVVRNCSLDRSLVPGSEPPAGEGEVVTEVNGVLALSKTYVLSIGSDTYGVLRREHHRLKTEGMEVSDILINLQDPAAPWLYDRVKGLGYFCTGMLPASDRCDYLVMQRILVGTIDYSVFQTTPRFRELLDAVRALDPEGDL